MEEKVTIIIPIYNSEKYLEECLETVINQTYRNLEIILVNDGSTDNSLAIMEKYAKLDGRIMCISQKNLGVGFARNAGLENATGKYISFIDSDDYVSLNFIEKLINTIQENDLYSYCGVNINGKDTFLTEEENKLYIRQVCTNKLYNAKYLKNIRFSNHRYSEDLIFNYKLSFVSESVSSIQDSLYFYRKNEISISNNWSNNYEEIFNQIDIILNYKKISELSDEKKERLEFLLVWYIIFGNFKRASTKIDEDYIKKSVSYIEQYFPMWYANRYIDKYIWDKTLLNYIINKNYDEVIQF